jgi:hypothetical protein
MKRNIETRMMPFEVREGEESDGKLRGRAVVYDSETVIGGVFREVIKPGAMTKTLQEQKNIKLLWNHDTNFPMGSTRYGTLAFTDSVRGLDMEADPPKEAPYSGFAENIRRGDVDSMSFGFEVLKENIVRGEDGEMDLREIQEIRLWEVSAVTFPAYTDTEIQARAAEVASRWDSNNNDSPVLGESSTDAGGDTRTTQEAGTSVPTSVEPDGAPDYILNRCELFAAEEELNYVTD